MGSDQDTIAAIGTAPGAAGISVVRVSGPRALDIADRVIRCRGRQPSERPGHTFLYGHTHDGTRDLDEVLVLLMRAPHSYTREEMVEIQGHGGTQAGRRNLRVVLEAGARLAEPGEFTKRAFLNGRLDLLQAEAVADLIHARSERAAASALEQLDGRLSHRFNALYDDTLAVAADLEATLDFPEDELPDYVMEQLLSRLARIEEQLACLLATWDEGHLLREGARMVIAGRPNVGKSTLLNTLLGKDRAIVTHIPGTTRDALEEGWVLDGIPLRLIDTAGLRTTDDQVEDEGIRRTRMHLEQADIYLYLLDASQPLHDDDAKHLQAFDRRRCVAVLNKIDLGRALPREQLPGGLRAVETSLVGGLGLDTLRQALTETMAGNARIQAEPQAVISERHRHLLLAAQRDLAEAHSLLARDEEAWVALAAHRLRAVLEGLGEATGRVYHHELLDHIFSHFCIGK